MRQCAPGCVAELDEPSGWLNLRSQNGGPGASPAAPVPTEVSFVRRFSALKARLGVIVAILALTFGGLVWFKNKVLTIDPGKGSPFGLSVRTETHIAAFIQYTDPHLPRISGRVGNTTTCISIMNMTPLSDTGYLNAAFLRMEPTAQPIPVNDPSSVLMVHTS